MSLFSELLFYYVMGFIAALALFVVAITGTIYGRGGPILSVYRRRGPILSVKSVPLRIAFFFISVALLVFLIWIFKHQLAALIQSMGQPS